MGAGHAHALYVHEHSVLHRMPPEAKLVGAVLFVICVAITPRQAVWAFAVYAVVLALLIRLSRVSLRFVAVRMVAIAPFFLFAFLIPFIAAGDTVEVLGVAVSREGLWGAWNVIAKASLGAAVSILLAATTEISEMLRALTILRVPPALTAIAMFMVRYLVIVSNEVARVRIAMVSRGYDPRWLWQAKPIASSAGSLFVRTYERGERVHAAMLSRGFTGAMPELGRRRASVRDWSRVASAVVIVASVAALALVAT